jgi:hypothetical protein
MRTAPCRLVFLLLLFGIAAVGCGKGESTGPEGEIAAETVGEVLTERAGEAVACAPGSLQVETELSTTELAAGKSVTVACAVEGCELPETVEPFFVVAGEQGEEFLVDDDDVTFIKSGQYEIGCRVELGPDEAVVDGSPALVTVGPGIPSDIVTELAESEVKAGTYVSVSCAARDQFANAIDGPFSLAVSPDESAGVEGLSLRPKVAGTYEVRCAVGEALGDVPAKLVVVPNVPARVLTQLASSTIEAGKTVGFSCVATDLWGNKVSDFPMSVVIPPEVSLSTGLTLTSTVAGLYQIMCVPVELDWALFALVPQLLAVVPGAATSLKLTLVPHKPFYKVLDKFQLLVAVQDEHGNLVEEAALAPIEVTTADGQPSAGIVQVQPFVFKIVGEEEQQYMLTAWLVEKPDLSAKATVNVSGAGPLISVDFPARGATLSGDKPTVTVTGTASDKFGLASFTVNGEAAQVEEEDNTFSHIVIASHGVNPLTVEAKDLDPAAPETRIVQAFAYSTKFYPAKGDKAASWVPGGLQLFLAASFVDDGQHDHAKPDDLATVIELAFDPMEISSFLPNPLYSGFNYKLTMKDVEVESPKVMIDLLEGGMKVSIAFVDFSGAVEAVGTCNVLGVDLCPDVSGVLRIEKIAFFAVLGIALQGGEVVATLGEYHLGLEGVSLDLPGLGAVLEPLLNGVIGLVEKQLESALAGQIKQLVPGMIEQLFLAFELDAALPLDPLVAGGTSVTVQLESEYAALVVSPGGIEMAFDTFVSSPKKVLHDPLGALGRGACAGPEAPAYALGKAEEVTAAFADDFVNQLLFAYWWGGGLKVTLDEKALESVAETLNQYGIEQPAIVLDFFLSPMFSDCNAETALRFGIGDLFVQANFKMLSKPLSVGLFVTALGEADLTLAEGPDGPVLDFAVGEILLFDYDVVSVTEGFEDLVPIIEELMGKQVIEKALEGIAGKSFGGLPLPELDLAALLPGIPAGTVLHMVPKSLAREAGYTEIAGALE